MHCAMGISLTCASTASPTIVLKVPVMVRAASCYTLPSHLDVPNNPLLMLLNSPV